MCANLCVMWLTVVTSRNFRGCSDGSRWTKCVLLRVPPAARDLSDALAAVFREVFNLPRIMGNPVDIRQWNLEGLPKDSLSTENGILVTRAKRWPLMIDPQKQANTWIKNKEQANGVKTMKLSDGNFLRVLEGAIRIGCPVLCEDLGEEVDPAIEPVLLRSVVKQGGRTILRLGETDVDYDENFSFYMTSKLPNPHYMPELCIKVTLINFTVTMVGLEDQLLGAVVGKERPDLEEAKSKLVVSMAKDFKQLSELEDKTLHLLSTSEGNVLDNEPLINTLNNSKLTSEVIGNRVKQATETEADINETRESYRAVATRGSIIYFVISDLGRLDPMYQYSLSYFTDLFNYCLEVSDKSDVLQERLDILLDYISYFVFLTVSRGLFGQHKLIYSFLITASIMRQAGDIPPAEWSFLLRGAGAMTGQIAVRHTRRCSCHRLHLKLSPGSLLGTPFVSVLFEGSDREMGPEGGSPRRASPFAMPDLTPCAAADRWARTRLRTGSRRWRGSC